MKKRKAGTVPGGTPAGSTPGVPSRPTPLRPVVFLALALFLPSLWMALHGNLSVQTALVRFIGALLVSWVAAWLVFGTADHGSRSSHAAEDVRATVPPPHLAGATGLGGEDAAIRPNGTSATVT